MKINRKASDVAEYIKLFGPFTRDRHGERTEQHVVIGFGELAAVD